MGARIKRRSQLSWTVSACTQPRVLALMHSWSMYVEVLRVCVVAPVKVRGLSGREESV